MSQVSIRHDNGDVVLVLNGDKGLKMPWEVADKIARGLKIKAREAEEYCKANRIIADNALLLRSGAPVGLSNHPKILEETVKEAVHNRELRRALPGGVKSECIVGTPTLTKR